jgi:hypothetical protein
MQNLPIPPVAAGDPACPVAITGSNRLPDIGLETGPMSRLRARLDGARRAAVLIQEIRPVRRDLKANRQRERRHELEEERRRQERLSSERAAEEAVALLEAQLGEEMSTFKSLMQRADWIYFHNAVVNPDGPWRLYIETHRSLDARAA